MFESVLAGYVLDRVIHASAFYHFLVLFFQTDFIVVDRVVKMCIRDRSRSSQSIWELGVEVEAVSSSVE